MTDPLNELRTSFSIEEDINPEDPQFFLAAPEDRGKILHTSTEYAVRDNPFQVEVERAVRQALGTLTTYRDHILLPDQVFENLTQLTPAQFREAHGDSLFNKFNRAMHRYLKFYLGKPRSTHYMGKKVHRAYTVKKNFRIRYRAPQNLSLQYEFRKGELVNSDLIQRRARD